MANLAEQRFYHGPNKPCAPHLPAGSPERADLFDKLRETFVEDWRAAGEAVERSRREKLGNLYFVTAGNAVKIGRTTNMDVRLRHIQAHNHEEVKCVLFLKGEGWRERDYHRKFKSRHIRGEWFERCAEIEAEIARLCPPEDEGRTSKVSSEDEE